MLTDFVGVLSFHVGAEISHNETHPIGFIRCRTVLPIVAAINNEYCVRNNINAMLSYLTDNTGNLTIIIIVQSLILFDRRDYENTVLTHIQYSSSKILDFDVEQPEPDTTI